MRFLLDLAAVVRDALDRIAVGTEQLVQCQHCGALTISTLPRPQWQWRGRYTK